MERCSKLHWVCSRPTGTGSNTNNTQSTQAWLLHITAVSEANKNTSFTHCVFLFFSVSKSSYFQEKCVAHLTHMLQARDSYPSLLAFSFLQKPTIFSRPSSILCLLCYTIHCCHWISTASSAHGQAERHFNQFTHWPGDSTTHTAFTQPPVWDRAGNDYNLKWGRTPTQGGGDSKG